MGKSFVDNPSSLEAPSAKLQGYILVGKTFSIIHV